MIITAAWKIEAELRGNASPRGRRERYDRGSRSFHWLKKRRMWLVYQCAVHMDSK